MPGFLAPFLVGMASAPIANRVVRPLVRTGVKATIGLAYEVRKLVAETTEELQDIAAEANAEASANDQEAPGATTLAGGARV
jgi:hypothetical protein